MSTLSSQSLNSTKVCKNYNDVCFTLVKEKTVVKDCLNDYSEKHALPINFLSDSYNKSDYSMCSSVLCNDKGIIPTYCIQCDSENDPNCQGQFTDEWKKGAMHQCPFELIPSGCYHSIEEGNTRRGCVADLDDEKQKLCKSDTDSCKKCIGNACNDRSSFQKCLFYDNADTKETVSKLCKKYADECFALISDETVQRGCMSDLMESVRDQNGMFLSINKENGNLKTCSDTDNCNDNQIQVENCIICNDGKDCKNNPNFTMRRECPNSLEKMGCYLKMKSEKSVERGCMSQLDSKAKEICRKGDDNCKMCNGDSCNIKRTFQTCHICDTGQVLKKNVIICLF